MLNVWCSQWWLGSWWRWHWLLLQLLCSMSAAGSRALWEDVTRSTPLSIAGVLYHQHHHHHHCHHPNSHHYHHHHPHGHLYQGCVQFTTVVSAQFWLLHIPPSIANERIQVMIVNIITRAQSFSWSLSGHWISEPQSSIPGCWTPVSGSDEGSLHCKVLISIIFCSWICKMHLLKEKNKGLKFAGGRPRRRRREAKQRWNSYFDQMLGGILSLSWLLKMRQLKVINNHPYLVFGRLER